MHCSVHIDSSPGRQFLESLKRQRSLIDRHQNVVVMEPGQDVTTDSRLPKRDRERSR